MAKRKRSATSAVLENRVRQGRGRGEGAAYKPWLLVHDVASRGRSSRILIGGRVAHTLSDWETAALRDFQWDPDVEEIKEQYVLEIEDTLPIAEAMKVRHPANGQVLVPLSTDLLVKIRTPEGTRLLACAIKESSATDRRLIRIRGDLVRIERTRQKLEIERRYWLARGVEWVCLTEKQLSKTRKANIEFMLAVQFDPDRPEGYWRKAIVAVHDAVVAGGERTLDRLARTLDAEGTVIRRDFVSCVRWLCCKRALTFDMNRQFELIRPASDFVSAGVCDGEGVGC